MRNIWDEEKRNKRKEVKKYKILPPEIEKYHFEYLARKQAFLETKEEIAQIFADYGKHLGDAGFSKI